MLASVGEDVTVYWGGSSNRAQKGPWEYVSVLTDSDQRKYFGKFDQNRLPVAEFNWQMPYWQQFNARAIVEIQRRLKPQDFIAIVAGHTQHQVVNYFMSQALIIEPEVGYSGILREGTYCCFESYSWMHNVYGALDIGDGRAFDTVIPNFQNPDDFEVGTDDGYILYMGRMILRKGVMEAAEIAKAAGKPIVFIGAGAKQESDELIVCADGTQVVGENMTYLGAVGPVERKSILSHASTQLVPTRYIEPFGTVFIEGMMSGLAPVATDWGSFSDNLPKPLRFRSLQQAIDGIEYSVASRGQKWRDYAIGKFSESVCAAQYKDWLDRLRTLYGDGWYARRDTI